MKKYGSFLKPISRVVVMALTVSCSIVQLTQAAENVTLKAGPIAKSVTIKDLENFATTGYIPTELEAYRRLFTPELRQALQGSFRVNTTLADKFIDDLFNSSEGDKLITQLNKAFPDTNAFKLELGLRGAVENKGELSALNFLKAYPDPQIKIDLTGTANLAFQLNASYLESKILSPILNNDLKVQNSKVPVTELDPVASTEEKVNKRSYIVHDTNRDRDIPLDIYYNQYTQGPLVIMSHGFGADRRFLGYLAHHLASYGFTVISIEHPGSSITSLKKNTNGMDLTNLLPPEEFINRPKDISFVLDKLAEINQQNGYLKGKFNTHQVTVIGHSFGGYTALALGGADLDLKHLRDYCESLQTLGRSPADWLQCAAAKLPESHLSLKDPRVVQVIAFNPIIGNLFGDNLQKLKTPTLILASTEDGITPIIAHQLKPFSQIAGEKYLLTAVGATHLSVTDIKNLYTSLGRTTLVKEVIGEESYPLQQAAKALTLAFLFQLTPQAQEYKPFLTPAYIQSLSNDDIQLRFNTQLPLSVNAWINVLNYSSQQIVLEPTKEQKPTLEQKIASYFINNFENLFAPRQEIVAQPKSCIGSLEGIFVNLLQEYESPSG